MMDAERLMAGFVPAISAAPFAVAPERATELTGLVGGAASWPLVFKVGSANFRAYPDVKEIEATFAALLSLWATSYAALSIGNAGMAASRGGSRIIDAQPGTKMHEALQLLDAAKALVRDPSASWPASLPRPKSVAPHDSNDGKVNNLFLGAVSWALLHEVAHVHLQHEETTTVDLRRQQEHEADRWAVNWVIKNAPDDLRKEFRIYAVATTLGWIGLIDGIRRGSVTHPHASERFSEAFKEVTARPESPGLELASYIIKVFFDPSTPIPDQETAEDAFFETLFSYSRLPR